MYARDDMYAHEHTDMSIYFTPEDSESFHHHMASVNSCMVHGDLSNE